MNLYINVISFTGPINRKRRRSPPSSEADLIANLGNLIEKVVREEPAPPLKQTTSAGTFWNDYGISIGKILSELPQKSAWRIRREIEELIYSESLSTDSLWKLSKLSYNLHRSILFTSIHFYPTFDY